MKVKVTQVRSGIGRPQYQKDTLTALGLGKINRTVIKDINNAMLGMLRTVSHLIIVEEVK